MLSNSNVDENVASGSVVGSILSSDPESLEPVTYELRSAATLSSESDDAFVDDVIPFSIDGDQLIIDISPDFESRSSYSFVILAIDSTGKSLLVTLLLM